VVLISDLLQDPRETLRGIGHLCYAGKDVTIFHVLDPGELRLPDEGLIEVEFLETRDRMHVDVSEFRELYLQRIRELDTSTDIQDVLHRRAAV
jgi:hypothetical protein